MRQVRSGWSQSLLLGGIALLIGCDRLPESGYRGIGPSFLLTATPGTGFWTNKASMPTARSFFGTGVVNGVLYAVGGVNGTCATNCFLGTLEGYEPVTNNWTTGTPMPTPRHRFASAVINGVLYVVGGVSTSSPFSTLEAYDPTSDTWMTKSPMPTPRYDLAAGVVNGKLYAVGGLLGNSTELATVEVYDPTTDMWTASAPLPTPRSRLGIGVVGSILYAIGGDGGVLGSTSGSVDAYDPATNNWTAMAPMPTPRVSFGVGAVNGVLHVVGGSSTAGVLGAHEVYDPSTNSWSSEAAMTTPRADLGAGVVDGVLYAIGGDDHIVNLGTNEAFTPPYTFTGFFQPVDNSPIVNTLKAGSAVPIKFSLNGNQGLGIFANGFPSSQAYTCDGSAEDAIEETATAGSSSLSYDATADQYTYVWKTDKTWAGTCRQFQLGLKDGGVQVALFYLTK